MNAKFVSPSILKLLAVLAMALGLAACSDSQASDEAASEVTTTQAASAASSTTQPLETDETEETADGDSDPAVVELFPDVVGVEASSEGGDSWKFSVTLSSPYDSPDRYADSWRVLGPDGTVYGERFLTHDHAGEQPFTRSQSGIKIPPDVDVVTVEGRDQISGWGGTTMEYKLPR